ncbi:MAG: protein kinase [Planctomycetes bacterium]|nr:protein kinase [Planctomycetota bacterium]
MDPREADLRRIFDVAIDLPPSVRGAYLDHECGADSDLRRRLATMLAAATDERFLASPTLGDAGDSPGLGPATPLGEGPGTRVGPYKLLQVIGEGGFGVVFLADQETPVKRRVALKVIKLGMDTRQVIARFEAERQALAMMDHPNIARVFDAGATESGRPYFVMELIKGVPITEYCDTNQLTLDERVELFLPVCHAVQHAHHKGVIHRDLKPGNILVTLHDGEPVPKVIDFGLAKATDHRLTEKTLFTEHRAFLGTPAYMSPEQAELSGLDVDTRTDVYSLGVLLYELMTGSPPFTPEELLRAGYLELQRIIREVEPPKPSTRVTTGTGRLSIVAALRRVDPKKLGLSLQGDLDWIVMRCLEKQRMRRYPTAAALADDLRRHLGGVAVEAAPPGVGYRARKFVKRHRKQVLTAAAVLATLLLGIAGTTWGLLGQRALRIEAERSADAEREAAAVAETARHEAVRERDRATELAYVSGITAGHAALARGNSDSLRASLERLPDGFAGWERRYLRAASDDSQWHLPTAGAVDLVAKPGGGVYVLNFDQSIVLRSGPELRPVFTVPQERVGGESQDPALDDPVAVVSPDGRRLWCRRGVLEEGPPTLWDTDRGLEIQAYRALALTHGRALFSPDSSMLMAWGGPGQRLDHFDAESGVLVRKVDLADVQDLVFAPDSSSCVVATRNGHLHRIDLQAGEVVQTTAGHVYSLEASPNGRFLACMTTGERCSILHSTDLEPVGDLQSKGHAITWATDGSMVAIEDDDGIRVHELPSGLLLSTLAQSLRIDRMSFIPDRSLLLTIDFRSSAGWAGDFLARIWDVHTSECWELDAGNGSAYGIAFLAGTDEVAVGYGDGTIRIWNAVQGTLSATLLAHTGLVTSLTHDSSEHRLISLGEDGLRSWDIERAGSSTRLEGPSIDSNADLAFSRDGHLVFGVTEDVKSERGWRNSLAVWDARSGRNLSTSRLLGLPGRYSFVVTSADGGSVAVGSAWEGALVLDTQTGYPLRRLHWPGGDVPEALRGGRPSVRLSGDLSRVALWYTSDWADDRGERTGGVCVYETARGTLVGRLTDLELSENEQLFLNSNGDRVLAGFRGRITVFDVLDGKTLQTLGSAEGYWSRCFGVDSRWRRAAALTFDDVIHVWDLQSGAETEVRGMADKDQPRALSFSPDGAQILCMDFTGVVSLVTAESGLAVMRLPASGLSRAWFDATGDRILVAPTRGNTYVLDSLAQTERMRELRQWDAAAQRAQALGKEALLQGGDRIQQAAQWLRLRSPTEPLAVAAALDRLRDRCSQRCQRVATEFEQRLFLDAVLESLAMEPLLSDGERADLLDLARLRGDDPQFLAEAALSRVEHPKASEDELRLAMRAAETALRMNPKTIDAQLALGLARLGLADPQGASSILEVHEAALELLYDNGDTRVAGLAALALAHMGLGGVAKSHAFMERARQMLGDERQGLGAIWVQHAAAAIGR